MFANRRTLHTMQDRAFAEGPLAASDALIIRVALMLRPA
jgi:hypothetical protein